MGPGNFQNDEALSALDWWQLAGVDTVIDDAPRDWLAKPAPVRPAAAPIGLPPPPASEGALPVDLPALHEALAAMPVPGAGEERLPPEGDVASGVMLMVGMPETSDVAEGRLLTGATGRLLDRMLGAIGRDRASVYLASLLPARPTGGRMDAALAAPAARLALRHVALAAPRILLVCGEDACRALLDSGVAKARGRLHEINHDGVKVRAIATFHPCQLLEHPMQKAAAWADLLLLLGELER